MENKHLFEGEKIIVESDDKTITLTSHRIRYSEAVFGKARLISIHLEKVSSVEMRYKSHLLFLFLGFFLIIAGIALGVLSQRPEPLVPGIGLGLLFIIVYWVTRKHVVTISSDGGEKINFQTKGMKSEAHIEFINKIETAKQKLLTK